MADPCLPCESYRRGPFALTCLGVLSDVTPFFCALYAIYILPPLPLLPFLSLSHVGQYMRVLVHRASADPSQCERSLRTKCKLRRVRRSIVCGEHRRHLPDAGPALCPRCARVSNSVRAVCARIGRDATRATQCRHVKTRTNQLASQSGRR